MIEFLGFTAATLTTFAYLPQALRVFRTKRTKDISLPMYLIMTIGVGLWFIYGIYLHSLPIIIANAISFILAFIILLHKIKLG